MSLPTGKIFDKQIRRSFLRRLFRRVFLEDWLTKVIALSITLALWLGVTGLSTSTTILVKGVTLKLPVSNTFEITNSPVQDVNLVLTGDKRKIDRIKPENLIVSVDLTEVLAGDRTVQLTPDNVGVELPTGVKLEEIQPDRIVVRIEPVEEREIPVKADVEGEPAENFEIYNQTITPPKVRVRGPKSFVQSLDSVSTEKIDIENRQTDFTARQVELNLVNPKVTLLDTIVDVFFKIGEKRTERMFFIPVKIDGKSRTASVVLYGARSILESLESKNIQMEILKNEAGENVLRAILPVEFQDTVEIRKTRIK